MFKVVSIPTPNVFQEPMDMVGWVDELKALKMLVVTQAAELKGVRTLLATVAENTVNTQEAVLAARVEAQAKELKELREMQQTLLKGQLELGKKLEVVSGNTITNRATLAALSADTGRLTDRVGGLSTRVDGLEETTAVHSRAIRDIQYFLPEIAFLSGSFNAASFFHDYSRHVFEIPVPEGFDRKTARFLWFGNGEYYESSVHFKPDRHSCIQVGCSGEIRRGQCYGSGTSIFWTVTAVRYPFRARLDEDAREAAVSSASASATGE